jgi:hypothetical protein
MSRHLQACKVRQAAIADQPPKTRLFHLAVEGSPYHWLHLEVPATATLRDLDQFLRDIWLECCGHLSMFRIGGKNFVSVDPGGWWNPDDLSMDHKLGEVLAPGVEFEHEYDFGTTTYLALKVVAERMGTMDQDALVTIMARNEPPVWACELCDKPATVLCTYCGDWGCTFLCEEHAEEHECGDEGFLPVVDSPRMGMCGYTGDAW